MWAVQAKKLLAGPPDIRVAPFKYERDDDYIYIYMRPEGLRPPLPLCIIPPYSMRATHTNITQLILQHS